MLKKRMEYMTHEYLYTSEEHGEIVILANIVKTKEGKAEITIWLKTSKDMRIVHFIVGRNTADESEESIENEIKGLIGTGYINKCIEEYIKDEEKMNREVYIL